MRGAHLQSFVIEEKHQIKPTPKTITPAQSNAVGVANCKCTDWTLKSAAKKQVKHYNKVGSWQLSIFLFKIQHSQIILLIQLAIYHINADNSKEESKMHKPTPLQHTITYL